MQAEAIVACHAPPLAPEYRYHLLRAAAERFDCSVAALDAAQRRVAEQQADRTFALESRVLASAEARDVAIPPAHVDAARAAVRARYPDDDRFEAALAANGMDPELLVSALRRELQFDAVMLRVGARHAPVTATDEALFYARHQERFRRPEQREACHILITINADFEDNRRAVARARIEAIREQLGDPGGPGFAALARRHSECPTAVDGGRLGTLARGQLYPELDAALFALAAGALSPIVESPLGFHLLRCERIEAEHRIPLEQARARIRDLLTQRRQRDAQRAWLARLTAA